MSEILQDAQHTALVAYAWLAEQDELLGYFLGESGLAVSDLADIHDSPDFMAAVLDFILSNEKTLHQFCGAKGLPYDAPMIARQSLPGGDLPHWT